MTTVWPSRRLRFGRSRRTRRGSDDGMEKGPPTVRRWGRVPPPRAGLRVPWFPSGVPRAAEHGNGRHHAKRRRTDPPQGDFQGVGRSGAQGKGVAGRIRPHWIPACHPVLVSMVRGKGFPRRAPAGSRTQRRHKGENKDGTGGAWRVREEGSGRARGPCGGSWGTVRRTGPGSGSSDHSSEPSVSAGAFALRRRETAMRAAPPPSTTTAASAISAMPAPVWARVLR